MSTFFIGYGVSIFAWGFLVDRFGPRLCAIGGILGWGCVLIASSKAHGIQELLWLRFALGVAEGNLWPVSNALTNRWFPVREHSRVQAFWITGSTLGTAIGIPVVTALILSSGWRGTLLSLSLVSLLPAALFYFVADWPRKSKGIREQELRDIETGRKSPAHVEPLSFSELLKSAPFGWLPSPNSRPPPPSTRWCSGFLAISPPSATSLSRTWADGSPSATSWPPS